VWFACPRLWQVLEVLLELEKGRQAVNKKMIALEDDHGCTVLSHAFTNNMEEHFAARKCIVLLTPSARCKRAHQECFRLPSLPRLDCDERAESEAAEASW